jgi:collagen type I/II/III/V/XI/XXIV/XXVII alpha
MSIIVNANTILTLDQVDGASGTLILTDDGTVQANATLDGAGTITGVGLALINDGTISSDAGGTIDIETGTLTNTGTLIANGASLDIGQTVVTTNLSLDGTLTGGVWESLGTSELGLFSGDIVVDNAIIILDGAGANVDDWAGGAVQPLGFTLGTIAAGGQLNVLDGDVFTDGGALTVDGTLTLGGGTLTAQLFGGVTVAVGGFLKGFGTVDSGTNLEDDGIVVATGGTLTLPSADLMPGGGTIEVNALASLSLPGSISDASYGEIIINNGTIDATYSNGGVPGFHGTVDVTGPYSGTGGFLIQGDTSSADPTVLELPGSISANIAFDANPGELLLDNPSSFVGTISGFGAGDEIVMPLLLADAATLNSGILTISDGGSPVLTLTLDTNSVNYTSASFQILGGSTLVVSGSSAAACYAAGTRIKTEAGDVKVEDLTAGDVVRTHFAGTAPVVWIGHRRVDCRRHPEPAKVWPVRIEAHAFGPRMPHNDLWLSPDHAVFVDDVLIPVKHLINGKTIAQVKMDEVTYYHVELAEHDVLLAEGMPAESYLENGDRSAFDNGGGLVALHPDFESRRWEAFGCAPLVLTGAMLDAVVARVNARVPKGKRLSRKRLRAA